MVLGRRMRLEWRRPLAKPVQISVHVRTGHEHHEVGLYVPSGDGRGSRLLPCRSTEVRGS